MTTGLRRTGDFCWINMLTPRPAAACEFFGQILGWTYFEMPGMGYGVQVGGRDVGGLFDLEGPNTPPGLSPMIGVMIKVENADATREKVALLGGTSKPAFDVLGQGRMAVCFDPDGAEFDVWEPKKMHGTDVDSTSHGAPSWFESMTTDVERVTEFYSGLFGWNSEPGAISGSRFTVLKNGGTDIAGVTKITPELAGPRPRWTTYFTVEDAEEAAREAVKLGGRLREGLQDIPGFGRSCGIDSPQGVMFNVIEYSS